MKKRNFKSICFTAAICGILAVSCSVWAKPSAPYSDNVKTQEDIEEIYQFELEGKKYGLPLKIEELEKDGWEFLYDANKNETIPGMTYIGAWFCKDNDKTKQIMVHLLNASGNAQKASECRITGLELRESSDNTVEFKTEAGITLGSSREEVEKQYGKSEEESSYLKYEFYKNVTELDAVNQLQTIFSALTDSDELYLELDEETGQVTSVSMDYYKMYKEDETKVSKRPDYLDEYQVPKNISTSWEDTVIKVDGKLYQLPAPLSEFMDNGWEFDEVTVPALNEESIVLKKDNCTLYTYVYNDSDVLVNAEDTYVTSVSMYVNENSVDFELTGGLSDKSKDADVVKAFPAFSKVKMEEESGSYEENNIRYYCYDSKNEDYHSKRYTVSNINEKDRKDGSVSVELGFDLGESDRIDSITITNKNWNYKK